MNCAFGTVLLQQDQDLIVDYLPENVGIIGKGVCPLLMSNIYWIQLVALQSFASLPHSSDKAFKLLDGAWTSLQALYIAKKMADWIA